MTYIQRTDITKIGDPFILVHNGIYYHYSTSSPDGFLVYTSTDLIHWTNQGHCYKDSRVGIADYWAPEVYHYKERFYLFFSSKNPTQNRLMISVAIADDPLGPFLDVSNLPVFDFGYAAIDGHVFFDTDGRIYLYYARDCSENIVNGIHTSQIYVVELDDTLLRTIGEPILIATPNGPLEQQDPDWQWNEGPSMLKHDGTYYLSYSINCFSDPAYSVCYATAKHPLGPFQKARENPILARIEGEMSGPGHNSYFTGLDGVSYTAFHIHTNYDHPSGDRRTCFSPYSIQDGRLVIHYKQEASQ